jgi:glyoxylase-like metal-dependent hydrolase (beta-lactamase superfamily II)
MVVRVTSSAAEPLAELPGWVELVRAPNPGPMTLDGTNTWILRPPGAGASVVIDPGPLDEAHLAAVAATGPAAFVLTTHGHPDHVEGLPRFRQLVPSAAVIPRQGEMTALVPGGLMITGIPTPGHTSDSACFVADFEGERVVLTGDTILGRGTTVVAHPDGDLGDYLASLRRLQELGPLPVLPGHGPALADCAAAATFYLHHRLARLEQVREVRAGGAQTAREVVEAVYADVEPALWPAAESSVRAQLAYLDREPR